MTTTKLLVGFWIIVVGKISHNTISDSNGYTDIIVKSTLQPLSNSPGKEIYNDFCIQCHGANGQGDGKNFPPLDKSDYLKTKRNASIAAVKYGQSGEIIVNKKKYNNAMPAMGLSNQEVADVMNYIMTSWSNKQTKIVTEQEVATVKKI